MRGLMDREEFIVGVFVLSLASAAVASLIGVVWLVAFCY